MTPLSIRLAILRLLLAARPYALPQETLLAELNRIVRPAIALPELVKHLSWLKAHDMVAFAADPMDPENADARRWNIREAGEVALRS